MGYEKNVRQQISYEYDFAKDGGVVGAIALRPHRVNKLESNLIIQGATLRILEEVTGEAGASAKVGDGTIVDGLFQDLFEVNVGEYSSANLDIAGSLFATGDGTSVTEGLKAIHHFKVGSKVPTLTIATEVLTAGKFIITFDCFKA